MKAVYKRELGAYFHSMIGSVCVAFMLAAVGLYFMVYNLYQGLRALRPPWCLPSICLS